MEREYIKSVEIIKLRKEIDRPTFGEGNIINSDITESQLQVMKYTTTCQIYAKGARATLLTFTLNFTLKLSHISEI